MSEHQLVKKCRDSFTKLEYLTMPSDSNRHDTLYGGRLLEMVDNVASQAFMRHIQGVGVTASVDRMGFIKAISNGDTVILTAYVSGVSGRTVEVFVKIIGEDLTKGERYLAGIAFLTFVALDKEKTVANVEAESPEERAVCSGYEERFRENQVKRRSNKTLIKSLEIDII